jgi:hypothetical protein
LGKVRTDAWDRDEIRAAAGNGRSEQNLRISGVNGPCQSGEHFFGRDKSRRARVTEDVLDLPRSQRFVDVDGYGADGERPKESGGGLGVAFQKDAHAFPRSDTVILKGCGVGCGAVSEGSVGNFHGAMDNGRPLPELALGQP